MAGSQENNILHALKEESIVVEPSCIMDSIETEISAEDTLVNDSLLSLNNVSTIHEIKEGCVQIKSNTFKPGSSSESLNGKIKLGKKRGRRRLSGHFNEPASQRSFSLKWLSKPELRGWLTPVPGKSSYVSCRWCKALLRAHLHDLKKHAISKKHRKHLLTQSNGGIPCHSSDDGSGAFENFQFFSNSNVTDSETIPRTFFQKAARSDANEDGLTPSVIGFIGCGNMAQALISGFISTGVVEPINLIVSAPSNRNLSKLKPLGIRVTHENQMVLESCDMIYLAVKPNVVLEVLANLEPIEGRHNPLFLSLVAGLSITRLEAMLSHVVSCPRVIRVMPNIPCMVLQGCCVYSLGTNVPSSEGKAIKCLFDSVGICEEIPENQIDGVCGLAGSGPAFIYAAIEAMADGGVKMGLPRSLALTLAGQTVKGAATMVLETGKHPGQLKDDVCSPSGTTITGMHVLEKLGFRNCLMSAVEASAKRSKELG